MHPSALCARPAPGPAEPCCCFGCPNGPPPAAGMPPTAAMRRASALRASASRRSFVPAVQFTLCVPAPVRHIMVVLVNSAPPSLFWSGGDRHPCTHIASLLNTYPPQGAPHERVVEEWLQSSNFNRASWSGLVWCAERGSAGADTAKQNGDPSGRLWVSSPTWVYVRPSEAPTPSWWARSGCTASRQQGCDGG